MIIITIKGGPHDGEKIALRDFDQQGGPQLRGPATVWGGVELHRHPVYPNEYELRWDDVLAFADQAERAKDILAQWDRIKERIAERGHP